jgi:cytochrome c oxidase subunit 2
MRAGVRMVPVACGCRLSSCARKAARVRKAALLIGVLSSVAASMSACERAPLNYMTSAGPASAPVVQLGWGLTMVSCAVIVIISALVLAAIFRRRRAVQAIEQILRGRGGLSWIYVGVSISTVVLFICSTWSLITLAHVARPPRAPAVVVDIIGHQWWWEVRYHGNPVDRNFTTANELHIPVGQPVEVRLSTGDVIHSFWVPQLAGKTDTIPGQTNVGWLQADQPGVYFGQCAEYCGVQHAHMAFVVVAEAPDQFAAWWEHQLAASPAPSGLGAEGADRFMQHCATCHTVRGTLAGGILGPNLSHLAQRRRIASGVYPNTAQTLMQWVSHPQSIKPGALMPDPALDDERLQSITAYLQSLH